MGTITETYYVYEMRFSRHLHVDDMDFDPEVWHDMSETYSYLGSERTQFATVESAMAEALDMRKSNLETMREDYGPVISYNDIQTRIIKVTREVAAEL